MGMRGIFLDDKGLIPYKDLSSSIINGVNRLVDDGSGMGTKVIKLLDNEFDDQVKKELILPYINDDLWITSDLHLNHKNRNSANFANLIINEINSKVKVTDAIMFLGDMGSKNELDQKEYLRNFLSKINCSIKILILGNHDIMHIRDWYDIGFTYVTDRLDTKDYSFTHLPSHPEDKVLNFHGHIHGEKEYWNMPWYKHVDAYIGLHDNKIHTLREYKKFYSEGKYKGKTIHKNLNKE